MHKLQENHLQDLKSSGLRDETIEELGFYSGTAPEVKDILGFIVGPGLIIPYPGTGFHRVKPDSPPPQFNAKYLSPKGSLNRLYVPPTVRPIFDDPSQSISITEGEKKAVKATQEGFPTVGIAGVWGFRDREHTFLPDLEDIVWKGRTVYVVPDSDVATNSNVRDAVWELGWHLQQRGSDVRVVCLPDEGDGKTGLDDYLVIHE